MNATLLKDRSTLTKIQNKIHSIAQCMEGSSFPAVGLMGGKTGEALFWAYYSRYTGDTKSDEKIVSALSSVFDEIKKGFKHPTFAGGLAGLGWTVEHLAQNNFIKADTSLIIGSLDDFLYPHMLNYIREGNYDYLHGAIGIGLYFLSRPQTPTKQKYLEELLDELEKHSTCVGNGIAWETTLIPENKQKGYNLSLSHGSASVIVFLCRLYEAGIDKPKVLKLLTGAIEFILQNKINTKNCNFKYPAWTYKNNLDTAHDGRLAWCYNDLGISTALFQAGNIFNNNEWKQEAISTLIETTRLTDPLTTRVVDAGLCHGTSGIAHIYNRMYNQTNIEEFKNAAIFWYEKTLEMASYKDGLAGYKVYRSPDYGGNHNDFGLLEGIAGIGLALISYSSDIESKWDRALMLS